MLSARYFACFRSVFQKAYKNIPLPITEQRAAMNFALRAKFAVSSSNIFLAKHILSRWDIISEKFKFCLRIL